MKYIKYVYGKELEVDRIYINADGVPLTEEMEKNPKIQRLLSEQKLVIVDADNPVVGETFSENTSGSGSTDVVVADPTAKSEPYIDSPPEVCISAGTSEPARETPAVVTQPLLEEMSKELDEVSVIVSDPENTALKTTVPLSEALTQATQKLEEDLKKVSEKVEVVVPEKKN